MRQTITSAIVYILLIKVTYCRYLEVAHIVTIDKEATRSYNANHRSNYYISNKLSKVMKNTDFVVDNPLITQCAGWHDLYHGNHGILIHRYIYYYFHFMFLRIIPALSAGIILKNIMLCIVVDFTNMQPAATMNRHPFLIIYLRII